MIEPICFPNSDDVVPASVGEVDLLLVYQMLKFVLDWAVLILLPFLILVTMLCVMTREGSRSE